MTKQELEDRVKELEAKLAKTSEKLAEVKATTFSEAKIRKICEDLYLLAVKRSAVWREWEMSGRMTQEDIDYKRSIKVSEKQQGKNNYRRRGLSSALGDLPASKTVSWR